MPLPAILGAVGIGAAGNFLGNLITNRSNRKQSQEAYQHDLHMWNLANEYNTPTAQMDRYRQAGLNDHLIYSQGNPGNAAQTMPQYKPAKQDYSNIANIPAFEGISAYNDTQVKDAQVDNLKASNDLIHAQAISQAVGNGLTAAQTARTKFDLGVAQNLEQNSYDVADMNLQNMRMQLQKNMFEVQELQPQQLEKIKSELKLVAEQIKEKEYSNEYSKYGIGAGDPAIYRILLRTISNLDDLKIESGDPLLKESPYSPSDSYRPARYNPYYGNPYYSPLH